MPFVTGQLFLDITKLRQQAASLRTLAGDLVDASARERVADSARRLLATAIELEAQGCDGCHAANPASFDHIAYCATCPCAGPPG